MGRLILIVFFFSIFSIKADAQESNQKAVEYPVEYTARLNVVYSTVNGWKGRMDLYSNPNALRPTPVVLNIHGGGWNHGDKESQTGFGSFFKHGYAVANVEYRLVDVAPAPAAIEDVRCALIYILNHAKELNIDTQKIVIMGGSAGGHLALMAGLLGNDRRFDTNCSCASEIKIAAIVDKYGIADLTTLGDYGSAKKWLGVNSGNRGFTESVSPIYYVKTDSPPTIIVHGNADPVVPYEQSVLLHQKFVDSGVKTDFISIEGGKHGKFTKEENELFSVRMWKFLGELGLEE